MSAPTVVLLQELPNGRSVYGVPHYLRRPPRKAPAHLSPVAWVPTTMGHSDPLDVPWGLFPSLGPVDTRGHGKCGCQVTTDV